jgi:tRNA pseudouridine55 synthase
VRGLLNIDKPLEKTSHDVVARVRWLAQTRRAGHAGTLDPLATGVLVVAIGRATRLLEYVVGQRKRYEAALRLGQVTPTYDGESAVIAEKPVVVTREELEAALAAFRGTIAQVPPMHSAVRRHGKRLYELARQGIDVEREAREVTIYELALSAWEPPRVRLEIVCSAGTYVRSLAHDLGQALGCGAYLAGLRRTAVGRFSAADAAPLATLTRDNIGAHLLPPEAAVAHLARLDVPVAAARSLSQGQWLPRTEVVADGELRRTFDGDDRFVGIVVAAQGQWRPHKILYTPDEAE